MAVWGLTHCCLCWPSEELRVLASFYWSWRMTQKCAGTLTQQGAWCVCYSKRWCNSHTSSRRLIAICRYCNHKTASSVLQNKAECIFGDSELQNNATHYELTFLAIWGKKISTVLQEDCVSVGELKTNASLPFHQILLHTRKRKRNTNVVGIDNIHCWL